MKLYLSAQDYQSPDDRARATAEAYEQELQDALRGAVTEYRQGIDWDKVGVALAAGGTASAIAALNFQRLDGYILGATESLDDTFDASAKATLPNVIHLPYRPGTVVIDSVKAHRDALVAEIRTSTEDGLSEAVQAAVRAHIPPNQIISVLRDTVGLTPRQSLAVLNYRLALEEGASSLDRALDDQAWLLRDHRFDGTIQRIADGEPVDQETIDRMVARYSERQIGFRARMIARTETLRVANAGARSNWLNAVADGVVPESSIVRYWRAALDERTCPVCISIPLLNPHGVGLNEPFESIDGPVMEPIEDTHPMCRCTIAYDSPSAMGEAA